MARGNPTVKIIVAGDTKGVQGAFSKAGKSAKGFSAGLAGVAASATRMIPIVAGATAAVGFGAFKLGQGLFEGAAQVEASMDKFEAVFADQKVKDAISGIADETANAVFLTNREFESMTATIADSLIPIGASDTEAGFLAATLMRELVPALALWDDQGRSVEDMTLIMAKAMSGQRDSLLELGIPVDAASVKTRALEIAQRDGRDEINKYDNAIATAQISVESSQGAITNLQDGTESLTQTQKRLGASFRQIKEDILVAALPSLARFAGWLEEKLPGAIEFAEGAFETLGEAFDDVKGWISDQKADWDEYTGFAGTLHSAWDELSEKAGELADWVEDDLVPALGEANEAAGDFDDTMAEFMDEKVWGNLRAFEGWIMDQIENFDTLLRKSEGFFESIQFRIDPGGSSSLTYLPRDLGLIDTTATLPPLTPTAPGRTLPAGSVPPVPTRPGRTEGLTVNVQGDILTESRLYDVVSNATARGHTTSRIGRRD